MTSAQRARFDREALVHLDALFRFARRICRDEHEAEDLVQETYERAFRSFHQFREGSNGKSWLFTILHNALRQRRRSEAVRPKTVSEGELVGSLGLRQASDPIPDTDPVHCCLAHIPGEDICRAVAALHDEVRTALLLYDLEGFSYLEIAAILEVPLGTVRSRIHRGRNFLSERLKDQAGSPV